MYTNRIKGLMVEYGYTQSDIAEYLGISVYGLALKLKGSYEFKASEIKKLSDLFNVSVDYFFSENVDKIATK